jgi:hypothetical protein
MTPPLLLLLFALPYSPAQETAARERVELTYDLAALTPTQASPVEPMT